MKRCAILIISILSLSILSAFAQDFKSETLKYKVMFKWGLVNQKAGDVTISLNATPDMYYARLTAASVTWADKFFKVRDTLTCDIKREGFLPQIYVKHAHEGGTYENNVVAYSREGNVTYGHCTSIKEKDGKEKRNLKLTLEATGTTLDMFSAFYYMRALPFQNWKTGHVEKLNVFSGRKKELLTIKYDGKETVDYDGKKFDCYKITFLFTTDGKKKSSDDMQAWISADKKRVPIKLEGKLPVGSVKCFLVN